VRLPEVVIQLVTVSEWPAAPRDAVSGLLPFTKPSLSVSQGSTGVPDDRAEPLGARPHAPQDFDDPDVVFRELDSRHGVQSDPEIHAARGMRVQDCAITHHAPRMLTPDIIRSEVVPNSDGIALALEPEECRIPMTLIRAATLDADPCVCKWHTNIGDRLKVGVFHEIHVSSAHPKELTSQSDARRRRHFLSLPRRWLRTECQEAVRANNRVC
jgi:hypothetical protein